MPKYEDLTEQMRTAASESTAITGKVRADADSIKHVVAAFIDQAVQRPGQTATCEIELPEAERTDLLTCSEAARICTVEHPRKTNFNTAKTAISRAIKNGQLKYVAHTKNKKLIPRTALDRWLLNEHITVNGHDKVSEKEAAESDLRDLRIKDIHPKA